MVYVKGYSIINYTCKLVKLNNNFPIELSLSIIDVSRVILLIRKNIEKLKKDDNFKKNKKLTILIIGAGKSGLMSIVYIKKILPNSKIILIDINENLLKNCEIFLNKCNINKSFFISNC
jgi:threonine dehydrogenase-like Zn-dependent dehydrogenase